MRGKEEKKGRGEKEKKRRKQLGTKSQKRKEKGKSARIFFLCAVVIFGSIRNTLFREKHTISAFVFMQDVFDEHDLRAKNPPHPLFAILPKSSGSPKDT